MGRLVHTMIEDVIRNSLESGDGTLDWAPGYVEPGYSAPERGVLFANWNPKDFSPEIPSFCSRLAGAIEKSGLDYELEWCDEWTMCGDCGKAVRTQPDSHGWTPSFKILDGCELVCVDCLED